MGSCAVCQGKPNESSVHLIKQPSSFTQSLATEVEVQYSFGQSEGAQIFQSVMLSVNPPNKQDDLDCQWSGVSVPCSGTIFPNAQPAKKKKRKPCQDNYIILHDETKILLCLFDGHGTYAEILTKYLLQICEQYFKRTEIRADPERYLRQLILDCEKIVIRKAGEIARDAGSTAVAVLLYNDYVYTASVGDSRAIGVVADGAPIQLTIDQTPEDPEERQRIEDAGGVIGQFQLNGVPIGPVRILAEEGNNTGLSMTRSIGDLDLKACGVSSVPILKKFSLRQLKFECIVIGSDGIWEVMSNQHVADFISSVPNKETASYDLCSRAQSIWPDRVKRTGAVYFDDISCVIVDLRKYQQHKSETATDGNLLKFYSTNDFDTDLALSPTIGSIDQMPMSARVALSI